MAHNRKQSRRTLESFDSRMHRLLIAVGTKPEAHKASITLPNEKIAFRFRMDLAKLNNLLKKSPHLDESIRRRLHGIKITQADGDPTVYVQHQDYDYLSSLDNVLDTLGAADMHIDEPELEIDIPEPEVEETS